MAKITSKASPSGASVEVRLGDLAEPIGDLSFAQQGRRQFSVFSYRSAWLGDPQRFALSPDLPLQAGFQPHKAAPPADSAFHAALADTAPDAWGRRVIDRAHAKARRANPSLGALNELDYLCAVDDFSRVGALRLWRDGAYLGSAGSGARRTPPLIELERMYAATKAVETDQETAEDLQYLQGRATSLGGMRPKSTVLDADGTLAIGKFPSVSDTYSVTRAEVLALKLAKRAGIRVAEAKVVVLGSGAQAVPVAVIRRFDRSADGKRIPYLSAASMILARRDEDRSYAELMDAMRSQGSQPKLDGPELWRRLAFNLLITNTDDHLQNTGFLYDGNGRWRLAPAFDLNPMPGKLRESKTWLSPETGPIDDVGVLVGQSDLFGLAKSEALMVLGQVLSATAAWREVAISSEVGFARHELAALEDAFEHTQLKAAKASLSAGSN